MLQNELERFLNSIECGSLGLENYTITGVNLIKSEELFIIKMSSSKPASASVIYDLFDCAKKGIKGRGKCKIELKYDSYTDDDVIRDFRIVLDRLVAKKPSLASLVDNNIVLNNNIITVDVISVAEMDYLKSEFKSLIKKLEILGYNDFLIDVVLNEEKQLEVKNSIIESQKVEVVKEEINPVFIGKHVDGEISLVSNITSEVRNVILEVYVFGIDTRETEKVNIINLKLSDKSNSIMAKKFERDKDEYKRILKNLKEGNWYRIHGNVEYDNYAKDLVLTIRNMESIKSKDVSIVDDAEEKRVELHLHTMMSAMDSVVDVKKLLKFAKKLGHKSLAVTDHNCLQAFPDLFNGIYWDNKKLEDKDKFKVIYGAELNVVNDDVDIIYNYKDYHLFNDTFVVFDTETTGFYAGSDQMIEIGAVKICKGEIIDRFDELIDPLRPIPAKITEITKITDEMVKGCDSEENVTKRFMEFVGDLPMIAHNAKFDISFMEAAYKKYNLGTFSNTVIDTMALTRALNPEWSNHKLSTLVKKFKVPWNEGAHHRADYDSEGTALCFIAIVRMLDKQNQETTADLLKNVNYDELVLFAYPFHLNVLAMNQVGLKNLFKMISLATTKYLFKGGQPKIPRKEVEALREGILIGSGCINNEIFEAAKNKDDEELATMMNFYDYIEVQPVSVMSHIIGMDGSDINSEYELQELVKKIIRVAKSCGKIVVATGDVHHLTKDDKIFREIIVSQKTNGRLHPLNRKGVNLPSQHFMTTNEMLEEFSFLDSDLAYEIVVSNTRLIESKIEHLEIIKRDLYTPKMDNSDELTKNMCYDKARSLYGEVLPAIVEDRLEKELNGIISNGYSVLYLIAEKLVKKSNDDGYFVGSRGSVGSSFVATMMGITEVNGLQAHYLCDDCKTSVWEDDEGAFNLRYASGYDLPDFNCPKCGKAMKKEGQDIPFATFLGFNAEKVPDIDLNFSGHYQAKAHDYTKVLFGEENVFRAGTIGTVADKTAFGFVLAYCEEKGISMRRIETERISLGCTGCKRSSGQHPGGIIVIPDYMDVYDFTPFQFPADEPDKTWYTTHFAFSAIHDNVLKLDILGHDDPTMLRYLGDKTGIDINTINFDDKGVLSLFSSPDALGVKSSDINCISGTLGVPEFGTNFVIKMLEETKPKTFAELVKISGLSHGTDVWVGNARDLIIANVCEFKDVIGCRDDILVYLMNHGVDASLAFKISEFVRKGRASKEPDTWLSYVESLEAANIPEFFIKSCAKIKYMFPKAHATAYVMMGFRVAWFKLYYPIYYYSAYFSIRCSDFDVEVMLKGYDAVKAKIDEISMKGFDATNKEANTRDVLKVVLEMLARGFSFKNIDVKRSLASTFVITEDEMSLIIPFGALDGLGEQVGNNIVSEREIREYVSIEDLQKRGKVSATTIEKLRSLGSLDGMTETSQLSLF